MSGVQRIEGRSCLSAQVANLTEEKVGTFVLFPMEDNIIHPRSPLISQHLDTVLPLQLVTCSKRRRQERRKIPISFSLPTIFYSSKPKQFRNLFSE
jgi:hypothetical protein